MGARGDPGSFDPLQDTISGESMKAIGPMYSRFYVPKAADMPAPPGCGNIAYEPDLAESWRWIDDTTLEVKLRQGVRFHDLPPVNGREVTASDVVLNALEFWPKARYPDRIGVPQWENVEATDRYTVRFKLKQANAFYTVRQLVNYNVMVLPPETVGSDGKIKALVGSGAFQLADYKPGVLTELKKNPGYWRSGLPYLDGMRVLVVPDNSTQIAMLRAGKLDLADFDLASIAFDLRNTAPNLIMRGCNYQTGVSVAFPNDQVPFTDVRVRRAINMAIDRQVLVDTVLGGQGQAAYHSVRPALKEYYIGPEQMGDLARYIEYRPEEAKRLLSEAGYPQGIDVPLIATSRFRVQVELAEATVSMLEAVGIRAKIQMTEYARYSETVYRQNFKGMAIGWLGYPDIDETLWDIFRGGGTGRNRANLNDPEMNSWVDGMRQELDFQKRKELTRKIILKQVDQAYYLWLVWHNSFVFLQPNVQGFTVAHGFSPGKDTGDTLFRVWIER